VLPVDMTLLHSLKSHRFVMLYTAFDDNNFDIFIL